MRLPNFVQFELYVAKL